MKGFLVAVLTSVMLCTYAQEARFLVAGDARFGGRVISNETMMKGSAGITGGVFIYQNWLAGVRGTGAWDNVSTFNTLGPMIRYYHFIGEQHAIYLGLDGRYGWGGDRSLFTGNQWSREAWIYGTRLGYLSRFNKYVALDVFLFYEERLSSSERPDGSWSSRALSVEYGLGLGLQIFL